LLLEKANEGNSRALLNAEPYNMGIRLIVEQCFSCYCYLQLQQVVLELKVILSTLLLVHLTAMPRRFGGKVLESSSMWNHPKWRLDMEQTGMAGEAKFINGAFSAVAAHLLPVDLSWLWLLHHHHHPHPPPPSLLSPTFHSTWPRWSYATLPNLINVAFDHLGALAAPVMASLLRRATRHHVAFKPLVRVV
jgi:hypothetical protein